MPDCQANQAQAIPDLTVAGAAARAAASAAAAAVCISYVSIGGALRAPLYVHDEIHTVAAEAAALAAAPAADPWIHRSISFIMNHMFSHTAALPGC